MDSEPLNAVGQTTRNFQITKYLPLEELQSTLIELVHEPTGARVMQIANNDPENLFCLSFQTLPDSPNGIAHILEHVTLCGSKKFPVKDPFFAMTRRSLNTFMNAMTGQDFTCYPAASQVEKDFYNLLEVYLDAVFHPYLKKASFLQEGYRLEFADPKVAQLPLRFQGVVYNEMKGAMSSSESRLWDAMCKHLTPDLPYANNSGGDPKWIPSLRYEELLEFHRNFYHPSRCLFFFYGDLPLAKHLDFIEKHALKGVEKLPPLSPIPQQKRFPAPIAISERYPTLDPTGEKDLIALSWLTVPLTDQGEVLALSLLDSLLMDTDASPLKKPLLQSGLCSDVDSSIDTEMSEVPWSFVFRGCDAKDAEKLKTLLFDTLRQLAETPFSKEEIDASLHQLEFHRKEIGAERIPYGLTLFFRAVLLKQHGSEPEHGLLIDRLFTELRAKLEDPEYLGKLLKKHLLENPHFVLLSLCADPKLETEEFEEEQKRLRELETKLTEKTKKQLLSQAKELDAYHEAVEHQSLECLPKISLSDVSLHPKDFPLEEVQCNGLHVLHHDCFTNQIVYADLVLDLPDLSVSDLPLLSFFTRILPELGSGKRNYEENLNYQQAYIGSFDAAFSLHISNENPDLLHPTLSLKGKALFHNIDKLFSLFSDTLFEPDLKDEKRIRDLLAQHASYLESRLVKNGLHYAVQEAFSGLSLPSYIYNEWNGFPYYQKIRQWSRRFPKNLLSDLERLKQPLLSGQKADLVLSCSKEEFHALKSQNFFHLTIPERTAAPWKGNYPLPKVSSHARPIAAPVAFTCWAMRTASYRDPDAPFLLIATELLENCVLHREIREKGGAYGGGASYSPSIGNFYLFSYRDPQLANTLTAFQESLKTIAQGAFNDRELEEAKLGVIQSLDAPVSPGARASVAYAWKRTGRTLKERELFRQKILKATKEEITSAVAPLISQEKNLVTFINRDLFHRENEKIKESLLTLIEN